MKRLFRNIGQINYLYFEVQPLIIFLLLLISGAAVHSQNQGYNSKDVDKLIDKAQSELEDYNHTTAISNASKALEESLKQQYKIGIIKSHMIIGKSYRFKSEYPTALNHYLQALAEIEKESNNLFLYGINFDLGELYSDWGVPEKALSHYKEAKNIKIENLSKGELAKLLSRIATTNIRLGDQNSALKNYQDILKIHQSTNDLDQINLTLKRIASIYNQIDQYENALATNFEILKINQQQSDSINIAVTYNAIGYLYKELNNLTKALEYFNLALDMNRSIGRNMVGDNSNNNNIVSNLINIGVIHQSLGDFRNSIKSINEALKIKQQSNSPVEVAVMYNYLASIYYSLANYDEAKDQTLSAIELLKGSDNKKMLADNYKRLTDINKKLGNYKNALESYEQYSIIKDSLLYREQLTQEREKFKQYIIENTEKESKLSIIDQEMRELELSNEKVKTEKEKQEIELLLREKELQNISLLNDQLEQDKQLQQLVLQQRQIEAAKKDQEIVLLEQTKELQSIEIQKNELLRKERQKEIELQNSKLELQQSELERSKIRQTYLMWTVGMFLIIILLIIIGYYLKQRDNKILQSQYEKINKQKEQIEGINQELIVLNEEKNDLIGIVAHDLKSPLNQISGILDLIKLTAQDQTEEQQEYISKIDHSAQRLKRMVTKILDVSAIESKTLNLHFEEVDLSSVLQETVERFKEMASKKDITINEYYDDKLKPVKVDAGYTAEVFENLISNGIKYSPLGKSIHVELTQKGGHIRAEFKDEGQGINEEDMKNLFGKYHKLTARPTAGEDSTGLGLSIVKKYVEAMNGKVWCESKEGEGANFIVEFEIES